MNAINIGDEIKIEMECQGRSVKWLAMSLNCSRFNVYDIYRRSTIDSEMLFHISQLLGRNFFELYTEKLREYLEGEE